MVDMVFEKIGMNVIDRALINLNDPRSMKFF